MISLLLGPPTLLAAIFIAFWARGMPLTGFLVASAGLSSSLLTPYLQLLPDFALCKIPLVSAGWLIPAVSCGSLAALRTGDMRACASAAAIGAAAFALLDMAAGGGWISAREMTDERFRIALALIPGSACMVIRGRRAINPEPLPKAVLAAFALGLAASLVLPQRQITRVVFDESHGTWETVLARFGPDDFGRAAYYTYSLLGQYAGRLTGSSSAFADEGAPFPGHDSLFVLKMPTRPLSPEFCGRLEGWVRRGGRLLVVADHTDLYDSAQHLNGCLDPGFGVRIETTAIFDRAGMPNVIELDTPFALLGRIDALSQPLKWQTGASFGALPIGSVALSGFGPSFSEPGDYSRQNRFGTFVPEIGLPYVAHTAIAAFAAGRGAVAVITDSTPWSNFALFREEYLALFRGIVAALGLPVALRVLGIGALILAASIVVVAGLKSSRGYFSLPAIACGLLAGIVLGSGARIGFAAQEPATEGREFGLRVAAGEKGRLEFLPQLVGPAERNFARIISAMAKYGHMPLASPPGVRPGALSEAKRWLLIEPEPAQIPKPQGILDHLRRGGDMTILFAPEDAATTAVREWLGELGLRLEKTTALAVAEDAGVRGRDSLMARRGAAVLRDIRVVAAALPVSILKSQGADRLLQSFTVRPTEFPRKSGVLNISFAADQFSDDAIGDVWEGVQPSALGRHRERQLAAALSGEDPLPPWPDGLVTASPAAAPSSRLRKYALIADGRLVAQGTIGEHRPATGRPASLSDDPAAYAGELRLQATEFIRAHCPAGKGVSECSPRLLGADGVEWMVSRVDRGTRLIAIELLHERSFSGLGETWNVVFSD